MKNSTKETLADKIAGILNTAPSSLDPEEDAVDDTTAQITFGDNENPEEEEILSKFRKQNIDLLADVDEKYAGRKTSRRKLKDLLDDEFSNLSEESVAYNDKENDKLLEEEQEEEEEESEEDDDDSRLEDEQNQDEEESDFSTADENELSAFEDEDNFKHISDINVSSGVKKGTCVRNQMAMWENLLEVRIQLQKCLVTANKMPLSATFKEIKLQSGSEFSKKVSEVKDTLFGTLDKLLLLQKLVLKQYPETKNLDKQNEEYASRCDNDEEILSDSETEMSNLDEKNDIKPPKKRKLVDYEMDINNYHKKYKNYRNDVIKKWHDKTKVVLKGGATSHSVLDQINYNLSNNKDKLVKRTQLKRSQFNILGENEKINEEKSEEVYNSEIFDDDDFYHQLLRELIEVKSADITDPIQLGRQWIQLQNMRSKMKRKVDTRATKGRKIRYTVHNKLVNFMAPIDQESLTDEAKTELYNSLFGKNQTCIEHLK